MSRAVTVVRVSEDGCLGLSARARGSVAAAGLLVGSARQLAFFPEHEGETLVTGGLEYRILQVDGRRIRRVRLTLLEPQPSDT